MKQFRISYTQIVLVVLLLIFISGCIEQSAEQAKFEGQTKIDGENIEGLTGDSIQSLSIDKDGVLWVGFWDKGINSFYNNQFKVYDRYNTPLPSNGISVVFTDRSNRKWFGTLAGHIVRYDGKEWKLLPTPTLNTTDVRIYLDIPVENILEGKDGRIWVLKRLWIIGDALLVAFPYNESDQLEVGETIVGYDNLMANLTGDDAWKKIPIPADTLPDTDISIQRVLSYAFDVPNERFYFTTLEDLNVFEKAKFKASYNYRKENSSLRIHKRIWLISTDRKENIWVGGESPGVSKFDGKAWLHYNKDTPLENKKVQAITFDSDNRAWIGVRGVGLVMYDGTNWKTYPVLGKDSRIWWREKSLLDLMNEKTTEIDVHSFLNESMKNPFDIRGKKIKIVGHIESGFEYADIVDENGNKLGIWPDLNTQLWDAIVKIGLDQQIKPSKDVEYVGYLELGGSYGHVGSWANQFYIVEMYPANISKEEKDKMKNQIREYLMSSK